jgi:hypothetical protein
MDEYHHRFIVQPGGDDDVAFIGWEVADQHALRELTTQLQDDGIETVAGTVEEARMRGVLEFVKFKDPSGIASEAYFGPLMDFREPFHSPRPLSGFVTGTMGLGHIVIRIDDSSRSLHFYRDVLGMRISDFIELPERPSHGPSVDADVHALQPSPSLCCIRRNSGAEAAAPFHAPGENSGRRMLDHVPRTGPRHSDFCVAGPPH